MSLFKWFTCAASLAILAITQPALAGDADFTMVNATGIDIAEVYISPANKNAWGNDRLGRNTLDNGKSKLFTFTDRAACVNDIKVVFDDNAGEAVWEDLDLCEINKLTLRYNRSTKTVTAIKE